jgi:hypothetical protein
MYKIDDEFRPKGRVFMKAQREHQIYPPLVPMQKSSSPSSTLSSRRGSAITTNLDDPENVRYRHEVLNEKIIHAQITEMPQVIDTMNRDHWEALPSSSTAGNELVFASNNHNSVHEITRNKRLSTDVLGSTFETTTQRSADGQRRLTTHIVRKITTMTRAEEQVQADNNIKFNRDVKTTEIGFMTTAGSANRKRAKVQISG